MYDEFDDDEYDDDEPKRWLFKMLAIWYVICFCVAIVLCGRSNEVMSAVFISAFNIPVLNAIYEDWNK